MQQITYVKNGTVTIAYLGNVMDNRFNEHVVSKEITKKNGEVWTPRELVEKMMDKIPEEDWKNPGSNANIVKFLSCLKGYVQEAYNNYRMYVNNISAVLDVEGLTGEYQYVRA